MKICIPLDTDRGPESTVKGHFGSAPLLGVVDVDSGDLEVVPNPELHHRHGSCHPVEALKALDVDAVVCHGVGRSAFTALSDAGIEVLIPADRTVTAITEAVRAGKARRLSLDETCGGGRRDGHGHAGAGCGQGHRAVHGRGHGRR